MADTGNGDKISRASLTAAISGAGVLFLICSAIFGFAFNSLSSQISEVKKDTLTKPEHDQFKEYVIERTKKIEQSIFTTDAFAQYRKRIDERLDRSDLALKELDTKTVPRSEVQLNAAQVTSQLAVLGDRLNELRKSSYGSVTVGDELKRLQLDIVELRRQLQEKKP